MSIVAKVVNYVRIKCKLVVYSRFCVERRVCLESVSTTSYSIHFFLLTNVSFFLICFLYYHYCSPSNPQLQLLERLQGADLGTPQTLEHENYGSVTQEQVHLHMEESRRYLDQRPADTKKKELMLCKNFHEMCTLWALQGECDANPNCKFDYYCYYYHIQVQVDG
jgi:hypothetical protein